MKRIVEQELIRWVGSQRRKPLVIRGARQVGKTWLVENVLATQFEDCVKIDLEKRRDLHIHFAENLDVKQILNHLELATRRIRPGKTLLFLDEIQACPRAVMALRYFYEEIPELHVVAAGSLLEFAFGEISVPVGRIQTLFVNPLTFYEYLMATGRELLADKSIAPVSETDEAAQRMLLKELRNFFFIGGMPECVNVWRDTSSMRETFDVQSEIVDSYRDDFAKYTPQMDKTCLDAVFLGVARHVGEQLKYTRLNSDHSSQMNRKAFDLLNKAKVIHKISDCDPSGLPLAASSNPRKFKASFLDIGLMQRVCQVPVELELQQSDLLGLYRGKLAEQFVAQELLAWHSTQLFYWSRDARSSNAEVDMLAVKGSDIFPIEVKSGKGGSLRSMHLMLKTYPNCPNGLVFYDGCFRERAEQRIVFLPLYSVSTVVNKQLDSFP